MTKVIQARATEAKNTVRKVTKNIIEFIQATSLVTVAAFSAYAVKSDVIEGVIAHVIAGAAAIIAVRGAFELLRSFNK